MDTKVLIFACLILLGLIMLYREVYRLKSDFLQQLCVQLEYINDIISKNCNDMNNSLQKNIDHELEHIKKVTTDNFNQIKQMNFIHHQPIKKIINHYTETDDESENQTDIPCLSEKTNPKNGSTCKHIKNIETIRTQNTSMKSISDTPIHDIKIPVNQIPNNLQQNDVSPTSMLSPTPTQPINDASGDVELIPYDSQHNMHTIPISPTNITSQNNQSLGVINIPPQNNFLEQLNKFCTKTVFSILPQDVVVKISESYNYNPIIDKSVSDELDNYDKRKVDTCIDAGSTSSDACDIKDTECMYIKNESTPIIEIKSDSSPIINCRHNSIPVLDITTDKINDNTYDSIPITNVKNDENASTDIKPISNYTLHDLKKIAGELNLPMTKKCDNKWRTLRKDEIYDMIINFIQK
jgi:hypothetical protein